MQLREKDKKTTLQYPLQYNTPELRVSIYGCVKILDIELTEDDQIKFIKIDDNYSCGKLF